MLAPEHVIADASDPDDGNQQKPFELSFGQHVLSTAARHRQTSGGGHRLRLKWYPEMNNIADDALDPTIEHGTVTHTNQSPKVHAAPSCLTSYVARRVDALRILRRPYSTVLISCMI